jgi:putative membrane protein
VVLVTFSCGLATGILMMMPRWWKKRKNARLGQHSSISENPSTMHHGI